MSLHPFSKDLKEVPTAQIEKQLQELRTKYLRARNPDCLLYTSDAADE